MPDLPIIPVGLRPNLSRTDRIEPQRVEPAFAISVIFNTRGVDGATLEPDQSRSVRTALIRHCTGSIGTRRGLCNRVSTGHPRASGRNFGHGLGSGGGAGCRSAGSGRTLFARSSRRHAAGRGTGAGGSGPGACRNTRHAPRLGDAGRCSADHRFALGFSSVRNAGRGDFRRADTAPVPGGSGL